MARTKKSGGEPGTPLIIALVFFILLSIGLGVMYYMASSENAAEKAKTAEAEGKVKQADKAKNEAQDIAKLHRMFNGFATAEEQQYMANPSAETKDAVRAEYTKLLAATNAKINEAANKERPKFEELNRLLGTKAGFTINPADVYSWPWPENGALPASPSPAPMVERMVKSIAERDRTVIQSGVEVQNAKNELAALAAEKKRYSETITLMETKLAAAIKDLTDAKNKAEADLKVAIDSFEKAAANQRGVAKSTADKIDEVEAEKARLNTVIKQLEARLKPLEEAKDELAQQKRGAFPQNLPHGELISVRRDGTADINLGSADNLKPGQTFTLQPASTRTEGLSARRKMVRDTYGNLVMSDEATTKGTAEVVKVIGPNLSIVRITEASPDRDPVLKGDLLYNPLWKKGARDHVVLFGIFDTDGDSIDDIKTVAANLEKQGVTVDGYFDLATKKWESLDPKNKTPGPNQSTTYAVKGWVPSPNAGSYLSGEISALLTAINKAGDDCKSKGVQEIKALRFFSEIGYRTSTGISEETVNQAAIKYLKDAPPVTAPMEK